MNKKFLVVSILMAVLVFAGNVYAAGQNQGGPSGIHEPGTGLQNPELKAENQGTGQGLQMATGTRTGTNEQLQVQQRLQDGSGLGNQVRNENQMGATTSEQRRSQVANAVQIMLQLADRNGGIGQEVKTIAQNQNQNQIKLEQSLQKIENRSGFAKFIAGPNYGEINNAQKLLEQNRAQIDQLNQVKSQLIYQGDQQTLTQQIQTLEQADLQIQNSLTDSQKGFSVLGWMFKLFSK